MRLHRISIKNFRGVEHFDVTFDIDGVTIVEGDNEIGKSCIPEALDVVLGTPDSSKSKQLSAIKPVHRDVGPEVEVEISTGDHHFVLAKRWLKQTSTTLAISSPKREQLQGRDAHDRVQEILAETLDQDLWAALNVEQGDDLALPSFNVPALGRALDAAAGGAVSTPHDENLWERIVAERNRYWTPTGQPNAERKGLSTRLAEVRERVASIDSQIAQMNTDVAEVERLDAAMPNLETQLAQCEADEVDLIERGRVAELAVAERRAAHTDLEAAKSEEERSSKMLGERKRLVEDTERANGDFAKLEAEQNAAAPAQAAARARQEAARQAVDEATSERDEADKSHRLAAGDTEHLRRKIEVEQLTERLQQVREAEDRLIDAEQITGRILVTTESLADVEDRYLDFVRADAALELGAAIVRVEALAATTIAIDNDDVELERGTIREVAVPASIDVEIPGTVRVSVTAGSSAQDLAANAARLEDRYAEACRDAGVTNVMEARKRFAEREAAETVAANARNSIQTALRDLTPEALERKIDNLRTALEAHEVERPVEPPLPPTHDEAQLREQEARDAFDKRVDELARRSKVLERATADFTQIGIDAATSVAKLGAARQKVEELERKLADARTQASDDQLQADLQAAQERVLETSTAYDEANRKVLDADPELLSVLIENAKAATKRISAEISSAADRRIAAVTRLTLRGDDGLQQQLDTALSELRHLEYEHDALERRAEVARLLHDVAAACRENIRQRYHGPFRTQIERLGRILLDDSFEVDLDDDLRIAKRTLDGITLEFDQLSAGAREQLGIISRIACATIVSDQGGAPVILDDTLGWTDPARLSAMGSIIGIAGKGCQIIVLTCTPGRYASVGDAQIVRLTHAPTVELSIA